MERSQILETMGGLKLFVGRALVAGGIDGFDQFMQRGDGKRCVEVIVHGVDEGLLCRFRLIGEG